MTAHFNTQSDFTRRMLKQSVKVALCNSTIIFNTATVVLDSTKVECIADLCNEPYRATLKRDFQLQPHMLIAVWELNV